MKITSRLDPAQQLDEPEFIRLGMFTWEWVLRLGKRTLPPFMSTSELLLGALAHAPADALPLGEAVCTLYVQQGGMRYTPSLQEGKLFWEALTEAISFLCYEHDDRVKERGGSGGRHLSVATPRAIEMEYIADLIIIGPFSYGFSVPPRREQAARVRLALALDPLCARAYTVRGQLAAQSGKFHEATWAYEQAMRIAALKIGPEAIVSSEVRKARALVFWADLATRDYMRPRQALAFLLWRRLGDLHGAIAHFQALLDLDPDDHQGNRYALFACLIETGDDEALGNALARHRFYTFTTHDDSDEEQVITDDVTEAFWHYTRALRLFRLSLAGRQGESMPRQKANLALGHAFRLNPFVPGFLLALRKKPRDYQRAGQGSLEEAAWYADMALDGWKKTPGSLTWLEVQARDHHLLPSS